jgi:hypothetical protein
MRRIHDKQLSGDDIDEEVKTIFGEKFRRARGASTREVKVE